MRALAAWNPVQARTQANRLLKEIPDEDFKPTCSPEDTQYWVELGEHRAVKEHQKRQEAPNNPLAHWENIELLQLLIDRGFIRRTGNQTGKMITNSTAEVTHELEYRELVYSGDGSVPSFYPLSHEPVIPAVIVGVK